MDAILLTSGINPGTAAPRLLTLRGAAGTRVRCTRGRGWITVEGDPTDYWINAGEDLRIRAATRVVIEADSGGELVVTPPRTLSGAYASPRHSAVATDHGALQEANMKSLLQRDPAPSYRKWDGSGAGVETALFISVQAVMVMCIVLVAAQLFATI